MRHFSIGMGLACAAAAVLLFVAPVPASADWILPTSADERPAAPDSAPAPESERLPAGRVGYAVTTEEFIGGAIALVLITGGVAYAAWRFYDKDHGDN